MAIRVANIIEEARWGGPQKRILLVASEMFEQGVHTTVILPKRNSSTFVSVLKNRGIDYQMMCIFGLGRGVKRILFYVFFFFGDVYRIYRRLNANNFDLVHVSGGAWQVKGVLAARMAGLPIIWHLNDTSSPVFVRAFFRLLSFVPDAYFVAAEKVRCYYFADFSLDHIYLVPAPVDVDHFRLHAPRKYFFGLRKKVGIIGNLNYNKGIDVLIGSIAILLGRGYNVDLLVLGASFSTQKEYRKSLFAQIRRLGVGEHVSFVPHVSDAKEFLDDIDMYVCASRSEASPMSVWEALSMSLPVISTDVGDVSKYIQDGISGFIVPIDDASIIADRLATLIDQPDLSRNMGNRARYIAENYFSAKIIAKQTANAYFEVIKKRVE